MIPGNDYHDFIYTDLMLMSPHLIHANEIVIYETLEEADNEFIDYVFTHNNLVIVPKIYKCIILDKASIREEGRCCSHYVANCFCRYFARYDGMMYEITGKTQPYKDNVIEYVKNFYSEIKEIKLIKLDLSKLNKNIEIK